MIIFDGKKVSPESLKWRKPLKRHKNKLYIAVVLLIAIAAALL